MACKWESWRVRWDERRECRITGARRRQRSRRIISASTAYVTLNWNAPRLANPNFVISCVGTDPKEITVSSNSGQQVFAVREKVGYYTVDCAAFSPDRRVVNLLGWVYLPIDVGGEAEMTEQAHEQDTRWAIMDKTRDAENTALFHEVEATMTAEALQTHAQETGHSA